MSNWMNEEVVKALMNSNAVFFLFAIDVAFEQGGKMNVGWDIVHI